MNVYIYAAGIYCEDCAQKIKHDLYKEEKETGSKLDHDCGDCWPEGPYSDGGGESDCPQHCGNCGIFLENPLTNYGYEYVRNALAEGGNIEVLKLWKDFYEL